MASLLQAAWGEDDVWSASVRYAGEFGGFRVAAGIGYQAAGPEQLTDADRSSSTPALAIVDNEWSGSLAVMHVASGLFVQGHYARAPSSSTVRMPTSGWSRPVSPRTGSASATRRSTASTAKPRTTSRRRFSAGTGRAAHDWLRRLPAPRSTSSASASCSRSTRRPWSCISAGAGSRLTLLASVAGLRDGERPRPGHGGARIRF